MGAYDSFNRRLETLVMEERTLFDPALIDLTSEDQHWLARELHKEPQRATHVNYIRHHTGFAREIRAVRADVERLYRERVLSVANRNVAVSPKSESVPS